jgi:hypothetical protein
LQHLLQSYQLKEVTRLRRALKKRPTSSSAARHLKVALEVACAHSRHETAMAVLLSCDGGGGRGGGGGGGGGGGSGGGGGNGAPKGKRDNRARGGAKHKPAKKKDEYKKGGDSNKEPTYFSCSGVGHTTRDCPRK